MNIRVFPGYDEMSQAAAELIVDQVNARPNSLLCFPSGDSPTGMLSLLVKYSRDGRVDFSHCTFAGLDEWVGMNKTVPGGCQHYLYEHFFKPAGIDARQIVYFDATSKNLRGECDRITRYLDSHGPLDLVVVGIGTNGHIGLNEPGVSPSLTAHVIDLAESTRGSAKKYFADTSVLKQGITLGLSQLMAAKTVLLIASGEKKAEIIRQSIEGPVTNDVPASHLQRHPRALVFLDTAAGSKLSPS